MSLVTFSYYSVNSEDDQWFDWIINEEEQEESIPTYVFFDFDSLIYNHPVYDPETGSLIGHSRFENRAVLTDFHLQIRLCEVQVQPTSLSPFQFDPIPVPFPEVFIYLLIIPPEETVPRFHVFGSNTLQKYPTYTTLMPNKYCLLSGIIDKSQIYEYTIPDPITLRPQEDLKLLLASPFDARWFVDIEHAHELRPMISIKSFVNVSYYAHFQ